LKTSLARENNLELEYEVHAADASTAASMETAINTADASSVASGINAAFIANSVSSTVAGVSFAPPVTRVRSTADPHVTNVIGQQFDIFGTGLLSLLRVPRDPSDAQPKLTVDGRVDRLASYSGCNHMWMRYLRFSGSLVNDIYEFGVNAAENSFLMRAGNASTESPEEFAKLAPAVRIELTPVPRNSWYQSNAVKKVFKIMATMRLQAGATTLWVDLVHNAKPKKGHEHQSHLNFEASNIRALADDTDMIGGLLGVDDHKEAMNPQQCQTGQNHRVLAVSDDSDDIPLGSFITASMA